MDFYTYIYYDPSRNNEPIYVGKGSGNRVWHHLVSRKHSPFVSRLKYMKSITVNPIIGIYAGLDEELSLLLEMELIQKFGRKDLGKGSLLNLTDGGEGNSGHIKTAETRQKMSKSQTGRYHAPFTLEQRLSLGAKKKGKTWDEIYGVEEATKRRIALSERHRLPKEYPNLGMTGKKHSEETKQKMRETYKTRMETKNVT